MWKPPVRRALHVSAEPVEPVEAVETVEPVEAAVSDSDSDSEPLDVSAWTQRLVAGLGKPRFESNGENSELSYYKFNVMSSDEILRYSVAEIKETKTLFGEGCVYDERMGLCENSNTKTCLTCRQPFSTCPGHFGHIKLVYPILHPMLFEDLLTFLRVVCIDCHAPILSADHLRLLRRHRRKGNYKIISQLSKKFPICVHCMHNQPSYVLSEGKIYYFYKDKANKVELSTLEIDAILSDLKTSDLKTLGINKDVHPCNLIMSAVPVCPPCTRPYVSMNGHIYDDDITLKYIEIVKANRAIEKEKIDAKRKVLVSTLEFHVSTLFDNSKGKARQINGRPLKGVRERINGKAGRIRNNLMGKRVDFCGRTVIGADPTLALNEVGFPREFATHLTIPEHVNRLNYQHLYDLIQQGKANYVIRGDKKFNLKYGGTQCKYKREPYDLLVFREGGRDVLVPIDVWEARTRRTFVIQKSHVIVRADGEIIEGVEEESNRHFDLKLGDIVERQLRDGDRVILNRQPTLHKGSMLCPKIKILPGRTLRLPISICSAYNADFDGDEMNIHVPQSLETISEAENIVATEANMSTSQFPRPIVNICQDNLTAGYMMTRGAFPGDSVSIERYVFFDACVKLRFELDEVCRRMDHIRYALDALGELKGASPAEREEELDRRLYSGYGLISLLLPSTLTVTIKNNIRAYGEAKEQVEIRKGVLVRGTLDKTALGNKSGSLVHVLMKDYGNEVACDFVTHFQYITDHWFLHTGFSISIADCMAQGPAPVSTRLPGSRKQDEVYAVDNKVKEELAKTYMEVRGIMLTESNLVMREMKINTALNNVRDIGARIAKESLHPDNRMKAMIESGAKGNYMNISQTIGLLGQQNVGGKRIARGFRGRAYPHYVKTSLREEDPEFINPFLSEENQLTMLKKMLESRGFVVNSYIKGLTPIELFTHQQGGREGLLSTAISTSTTGYLQRRIVKVCEDVKSTQIGTICNEKGSIVQFSYGQDGLDNSKLLYVKGKLNFIDVARKAEQINNRLEDEARKAELEARKALEGGLARMTLHAPERDTDDEPAAKRVRA